MTDPTPATVAVPVELLERLLSEGFTITNVDEARALRPKPSPRLVAVIPQHMGSWMTETGKPAVLVEDLENQPDLLALLDEAMRPVMLDDRLSTVMSRICAALGVTE